MLDWEVEGSSGATSCSASASSCGSGRRSRPWMTCSRCLEPVAVDALRTDTRFRFAASEQQAAAEDREAEEEEVIAASPHLDLAALGGGRGHPCPAHGARARGLRVASEAGSDADGNV